jgi:hypothetical protein
MPRCSRKVRVAAFSVPVEARPITEAIDAQIAVLHRAAPTQRPGRVRRPLHRHRPRRSLDLRAPIDANLISLPADQIQRHHGLGGLTKGRCSSRWGGLPSWCQRRGVSDRRSGLSSGRRPVVLASCTQLACGSFGELVGSHVGKHLVRRADLVAEVHQQVAGLLGGSQAGMRRQQHPLAAAGLRGPGFSTAEGDVGQAYPACRC